MSSTRATSNSTTAFAIQNTNGSSNLFAADTLNGQVKIAGTELIQSSSATALQIQDSSGVPALAFDGGSHILKIYDTTGANYASITATSSSATFASNTGTTIVGAGSGNISLQLTNQADVLTATKTLSASSTLSTTDFSFTRNITGGSNALQGSVLKVEDLSTFSGGSSSPNLLYINQNNASATGNLILVQTGGSTTKLSLTTAGDLNIAGVYKQNGTSGATIICSGAQLLSNSTYAGGLTTGGTCVASNSVETLQDGYNNSATPANILLANAKDLTITAADTATDPNILFNLQCVTSCGTNGRFAVQNAGSDYLAVNSNGTIVIGTSTNNTSFGSDGTLTFNGTARHTRRYTLSPEYEGATMTGDGTANTGTMTSDFCSGSSHLNIGATCSASAEHNYYKWVSTSGTNDYDIYVRFRMPSDYSRNSGNTNTISNFNMFGYGTTSGTDKVELTVYNASMAVCGTTSFNTATTNVTWTENALTSISGDADCDGIVADDLITLRIHMISSGASNIAQAGEIRFDYLSKW
jgi:hypothetical protein